MSLILPSGLTAARPSRGARKFGNLQRGDRAFDVFGSRQPPLLPEEGQLQLNIARSDDAVLLLLQIGDRQIQIPLPPQQAEGYGLALIGLSGQIRLIQQAAEAEAEPKPDPAKEAEQDRLIAELMAEQRPTVADAVTDSSAD